MPSETATYDDLGYGPVVPEDVPIDGVPSEDRFEVLGEHARGGLGRVLKANDRLFGGRLVAIKELLSYDARREQRFRREAMITAQLEHPGVVPVYHVGRWRSGTPFYVMKMVEGRSLAELIDASQGLEPRLRLLPHVAAVADTMAYVHSRGVIHRDLKPGNVVIGDYGETVVIDWGLAKRVSDGERPPSGTRARHPGAPPRDPDSLTRDGAIMGTPQYMAPEQLLAQRADERSDVYAIGGILFHVLTGQPPHQVTGDAGASARPRATRSVRELEPRVPRELVAIVDRSLGADPDTRYPDCAALAEDLRRFERGQLIAAHRYSRRELTLRWLGRHRTLLVVGGLLAATATAAAFAWRFAGDRAGVTCAVGAEELAGTWDDDARRATRAAFAASGHPRPDRVFERFAGQLDAYTAAWRSGTEAACVDTHHRGRQSAAALDRRTACLAERRSALRALVEVYRGDLDPDGVDRAVVAAARLPALDTCADVATLDQRLPMPVDPAGRTRLAEVSGMLDTVRAQESAGMYRSALSAARAAIEAASSVDDPRVQAQARQVYASLLRRTGTDPSAAEALLREAIELAARARDDLLVSSVWIDYLWTLGLDLGQPQRAIDLEHAAWVAAVRVGGQGKQRGAVLQVVGVAHNLAGQVDRGLERLTRAAALFEADPSTRPDTVASVLNNTAYGLITVGDFDRAAGYLERGLAVDRSFFGAGHPELAFSLHNLGRLEVQRGNLARADELLTEALATRTERLGLDHPLTLTTRLAVATLDLARGQRDRGLATMRQVYAIQRSALAADNPDLNETRTELARALGQAGAHDEAAELAALAVVSLERGQTGRVQLAEAQLVLAQARLSQGRRREAAALAREARAGFERVAYASRAAEAAAVLVAAGGD